MLAWLEYRIGWLRSLSGRRPARARFARVWRAAAIALAIGGAATVDAGTGPATAPSRWSQFADLVFNHYTADTGLPFTGVTAIAQDRRGFLWIGSQSGVARWDGLRFRVYRTQDSGSGLPDNLVKVLHLDARGRLWVGTNAGGMARYDPVNDRFVPYGAGPRGLSHAGVRAIEDDGRGGLWVATSGGLDHIDSGSAILQRYHASPGDPGSLPASYVSALLRTRDGGLWVGTAAGLSFLDTRTGRFRRLSIPGHGAADQPAVTAIVDDGEAGFWFGTVGAGAFRVDAKRRIALPVLERGERSSSLQRQTITTIAKASGGNVWIATAGRGIVIVDALTGETRRIVHDARIPSSLADDAPVALFGDRAGALWVGTQRALSRYDPSRTGVWTLLGGTQRPGTASSPDVTAVLGTADGRIWLGLRGGGVNIVDPATGTITDLGRRSPAMSRLAAVSALAELPDGRVLMGTNAGLFETDRTGSAPVPFGFPGTQGRPGVTSLLVDGRTLWIGRLDGVWKADAGAARPPAPVRVAESSRMSDERVMSMARAADGSLWVGTQNGLNRLVPGRGVAERIALSGSDADGLVPTVLIDARGRVWAGVYGRGVTIIDRGQGGGLRLKRIDVAQGLPDSNVDKLLEDGAGRVWASTDDGLALIDPASLSARKLQQPDAVAIAAYWNGSGARTAGGQLVYGGLGGATIIDPRRVAAARAPAPLELTELRVGGKDVAAGLLGNPGSKQVVTIRPDGNSLFAEFASLDYADPAGARYTYRLRGYEDEWSIADAAHRSAAYTNLPPGHYVLELRSVPALAGVPPVERDIPVTVLPTWYQTIWFKLVVAILIAGLVIAIIQLRTAVLRKRQRELESLVADRTAALRKTQRELEQIAYIDALTGLPNRRMFNDQLRTCLERADRLGTNPGLLLIDLDRFKAINDTRGHDAGDALLVEVATRLQTLIREHDTVARLGGDEFAILVPDATDVARVEGICRDIARSVAEPVCFGGVQLRSGASIGIAVYKPRSMTSSELYKAADLALYAAKKQGTGSWMWFREALANPAEDDALAMSRRSLR